MSQKHCRYGFSCAAMMQSPGLRTEDCPNLRTCGTILVLSEQEEVELIRVRQEAQQQLEALQERFRVNREQAAQLLLLQRGCPQTPEDLGLTAELLEAIAQHVAELPAAIEPYRTGYIAPRGSEIHRYAVSRPYGQYWYVKLTANAPIFAPVEQTQPVRFIHLSHEDSPRAEAARSGIAKRNKIVQAVTQLNAARVALEAALRILQEEEPSPVSGTDLDLVRDDSFLQPSRTSATDEAAQNPASPVVSSPSSAISL